MEVFLGRDERGSAVGTYLMEWLAHMRGRVRAKTHPGTRRSSASTRFPPLATLPLSELNPLDLQCLYGTLLGPDHALSGGTVLNLHLVLTQALGQAQG